MFRLLIEIVFCFLIVVLIYFIVTGQFCRCSSVKCNSVSEPLRSYIS